jgi:hypothetical protein
VGFVKKKKRNQPARKSAEYKQKLYDLQSLKHLLSAPLPRKSPILDLKLGLVPADE